MAEPNTRVYADVEREAQPGSTEDVMTGKCRLQAAGKSVFPEAVMPQYTLCRALLWCDITVEHSVIC